MTEEEDLAAFAPEKETLLTIGVFDGVHLGHQRLIEELLKQADKKHLLAGVVTFRQHPEDVLSPGKTLPFLTDIKTRTKLLKDEGVDFIWMRQRIAPGDIAAHGIAGDDEMIEVL